MNPLEDIIVAIQPITPTMPFPIPDSIRLMDVTGGPSMFTGVVVVAMATFGVCRRFSAWRLPYIKPAAPPRQASTTSTFTPNTSHCAGVWRALNGREVLAMTRSGYPCEETLIGQGAGASVTVHTTVSAASVLAST